MAQQIRLQMSRTCNKGDRKERIEGAERLSTEVGAKLTFGYGSWVNRCEAGALWVSCGRTECMRIRRSEGVQRVWVAVIAAGKVVGIAKVRKS